MPIFSRRDSIPLCAATMNQESLLAIDVGNSRIKWGVFDRVAGASGALSPRRQLAVSLGMAGAAAPFAPPDQFAQESISACVIAGPNPQAIQKILDRWDVTGWPRPKVFRESRDLPIEVPLPFPNQVGIDRLLNGIAANALRPPETPAIVVSAGTATTVDLISSAGAFLGGAILPGLEMGARALHEQTALLPLIDLPELLRGDRVEPLGDNTVNAIRSGVWYGHLGAIREVVSHLTLLSERKPPLVLVTGGNGAALAGALGSAYRFEADLALRGLAVAAAIFLAENSADAAGVVS
jgi:type III pantothenate kinase